MNPSRSHPRSVLACLGDASRFQLVCRLIGSERCVTELAIEVGLSQSCTTRHLQALERAGLVLGTRHGKKVVFRLRRDAPEVGELLEWVLHGAGVLEAPAAISHLHREADDVVWRDTDAGPEMPSGAEAARPRARAVRMHAGPSRARSARQTPPSAQEGKEPAQATPRAGLPTRPVASSPRERPPGRDPGSPDEEQIEEHPAPVRSQELEDYLL